MSVIYLCLISVCRKHRGSAWPLMGRQNISLPSSLLKVDSPLPTRSATLKRLQNSLVNQHLNHLDLTNLMYLCSTFHKIYNVVESANRATYKNIYLHLLLYVFAAGTLSLGLQSGVLIAVPIPEEHAAVGQQIEEAIQAALTEARYMKVEIFELM